MDTGGKSAFKGCLMFLAFRHSEDLRGLKKKMEQLSKMPEEVLLRARTTGPMQKFMYEHDCVSYLKVRESLDTANKAGQTAFFIKHVC